MKINRYVQQRSSAMTKVRLAILHAIDKEENGGQRLSDWELACVYTHLAHDHVRRATMAEHREESDG